MVSELWLRRQAMQIAAQLPENPEEALLILEYASEVVNLFLRPHSEPGKPQGEVLPFRVVSAP
jgi:hypothetical protein